MKVPCYLYVWSFIPLQYPKICLSLRPKFRDHSFLSLKNKHSLVESLCKFDVSLGNSARELRAKKKTQYFQSNSKASRKINKTVCSRSQITAYSRFSSVLLVMFMEP